MADIHAKALQQLKDLASYPLPQLEKLAANLSIRQLKKNKIIFEQDEDATLVYLLLSGVVKFSYLHSDEKQTIVSLHSSGRVFRPRFADAANEASFQMRSVRKLYGRGY